ncbi:MAG: hypothetical protein ACKOWR_00385 [Micrococcales bacterium]
MTNASILESFLKFSEQLKSSLASRPAVIGLVFVGSTADTSRVDRWSDHDFFVITKPGEAESLRTELSWLPNHQDIVISPRETAHGLKVVYRNGHVLEFAVFEDSELELASANAFLVAIDRGNIGQRMAAIAERSGRTTDFDDEFGLLLSHFLIAVGRYRRGEVLTAGETIRGTCVNHLLGLIRSQINPKAGTEKATDNLNRLRRFELQYPNIAARLSGILMLQVEDCARAQYELLVELIGPKFTDRQQEQAKVVSELLAWN